jgi:hypothetical protein
MELDDLRPGLGGVTDASAVIAIHAVQSGASGVGEPIAEDLRLVLAWRHRRSITGTRPVPMIV